MSEEIIAKEVSEETKEEKDVVETTYTKEQTESYIKKLRIENEKLRKDSEAKLELEKEAKKKALEEQGKFKELYETLQKEAEASKTENSKLQKLSALRLALRDASANHPELLEGKFDLEKIELVDNKIQNWELLVAPIKDQYKDLFGKEAIEGYDPNKGKIVEGFYTKSQIEAMSDRELRDPKILEKVNKSLEKLRK